MDGTARGNEFAGRRDARDYPLVNRLDEVDRLMMLDNVLIP
jgi:aromatic ring hydroxylase